MNSLYMIVLSVLFGGGYVLVATLLGEKFTRLAWRDDGDAELRALAAPLFGVVAHAVAASAALLLAPGLLPWLPWILVAAVVLDWKGSVRFVSANWRGLGLVTVYGLLCFAILVSFHVGAGRGDNLFWSIYNLTAITPGDSPQGLLQAQYLLHGQSLVGLQNFSLFDRPFLAGIVSLAALAGTGQSPGITFNDFPAAQAYLYIALWTWLNATFALTVAAIARRFAPERLQLVATLLVLAAPFLVFNIIGAWPKLFAAYITSVAAILALKGRWRWAVIASGIAFLAHGSFLWSHLSMCGLLVIYVAFFSTSWKRLWEAGLLGAMAAAFPVAWFLAEHHFGATTPLRTYYLYSVPVSYGLTHDTAEIARGFYTATNPGNLALLPFVNILKGLLPSEMLTWLVSFSIAGTGTDLRRIASALFYTQFNRPMFSLCLTAGLVACLGLWRGVSRNWSLALAVAAFFLLPLIPGMGIYRRDDHFISPVMLFAILPLLMAFSLGLGQLSRRGLLAVTTLVMAEYSLLYWARYPGIRYESDFFEYYLWLSLAAVVVTYFVILRCLRQASTSLAMADYGSPIRSWFAHVAVTPYRLAAASLAVAAFAGLCGPILTQQLMNDGGFVRYGWNIDLSRWSDLTANRDGQALLHTDLRSIENGVDHGEIWINTGQSLTFRNIPATEATKFSVSARIHPAWNAGATIEPVAFRAIVHSAGVQEVAEVTVEGAREQAGEWRQVAVDLSKFSGRNIKIEISPVAKQSGIWTLWRDPAISVAR